MFSLVFRDTYCSKIFAFSDSKVLLESFKSQIEFGNSSTIVPTTIYEIERIPMCENIIIPRYQEYNEIFGKDKFEINLGLCYSLTKKVYSDLNEYKILKLNLLDSSHELLVSASNNFIYEELSLLASENYCEFDNSKCEKDTLFRNSLSDDE